MEHTYTQSQRYSDQELKQKANELLVAYRQGDPRVIAVMQTLCGFFAMQQQEFFRRVAELADMD